MRKCKSWKRRGMLFAVKINVSAIYLHWISMPINHVLWTWMMRTCVAPVKVKLKCSVCSIESTATHFNFIFCQFEFYCAMGEMERQVCIVTVWLNRNIFIIIHTNSSVSFLDFWHNMQKLFAVKVRDIWKPQFVHLYVHCLWWTWWRAERWSWQG